LSALLKLPLVRARNALTTAEAATALDALCELLAAVVDGLGIAGSEEWSRYLGCLTRDGGSPVQAIFPEQIGTELVASMVRLIAAATGDSAGGKQTRLRACMLLGQVSSLYEHRGHTLAAMGWSQFDEQAVALIKSVIREHTRGALVASRTSSTQTERRPQSSSWAQTGG
jgi:hypothetical protein